MSIALIKALAVLGINPDGSMTGPQIIASIDMTIGDFWKQGVSGAVLVNDLQQDSADLAQYLNIDGKWHIPDKTVLIINTTILTDESRIGRNIYAEGDIQIVATSGTGKGIYLADGYGVADSAIENLNGGTFISNVVCFSTSDIAFFNIENSAAEFSIKGYEPAIIKTPGILNSLYVTIDTPIFGYCASQIMIGENCGNLFIGRTKFNSAGFYQALNGFDCSTAYSGGARTITVSGASGMPSITPLITIDADNGDNIGVFQSVNCDSYDKLIYAASDSTFNANPLLSTNFQFDVIGFGKTSRLGECYFSGNSTITITTQDVWTDFFDAAIAEGDLSNGFAMTANPGEIEYVGSIPVMVRVSTNVQGYPHTGTPEFIIGAFYKPSGGTYALVSKGGYDLEQDTHTSGGGAAHSDFEYTILITQGDMIKTMIKNTTNTNDFELHNYSEIVECLS
jgi:hypothetical protein